ncbi:ABC transporter substrate-binding protein [Benzoatithermus flavus]|uniref:ABC transporter substrate-binding protein n=1 Tax=Benzoatithermus flavus TaxID=3108223 RepID=A0ABU8XZI9_9PROT
MPDDAWPVRLGLLRLTDAAPVFLAEALGLFAAEGAAVQLSVEPSWANIADKLAFGLLDAAMMLPPLALAMEFGLRGPKAPLVVPMGLSLNGNSIVLTRKLADAVLEGDERLSPPEAGQRLRHLLRSRPRRPRLAVVHTFSTHDLLLRCWLAASGIDPEQDVELVVVPPVETAAALASGRIDGFCAGAPWGAVAARSGIGRTVLLSSAIWPNHPEKCLAARADWAARHPAELQGLLRALLRASAICGDPVEAGALAVLLAARARVGVPAELIAPSLGSGESADVDRSLFAAHAATFPSRAHARWLTRQMGRWRALPADAAAKAERLYRPDLYAEAARAIGLRELPDPS